MLFRLIPTNYRLILHGKFIVNSTKRTFERNIKIEFKN
jgi:hypothetical protein